MTLLERLFDLNKKLYSPHTGIGFGIIASSIQSICTTKTFDHVAGTGTEFALNVSGNFLRLGTKLVTSSPAIGTNILKVKYSLRKVNSPTGNVIIRVRNSSDTILESGSTLDSATLTTGFLDYEFTLDSIVNLSLGDRVLLEYLGASGDPNSVRVEVKTETSETGYERTGFVASYLDTTTENVSMTFDSDPTCP